MIEQPNDRLVRALRGAMSCYAKMWRRIRFEIPDEARAGFLLAESIRLRDLSNDWRQHPV